MLIEIVANATRLSRYWRRPRPAPGRAAPGRAGSGPRARQARRRPAAGAPATAPRPRAAGGSARSGRRTPSRRPGRSLRATRPCRAPAVARARCRSSQRDPEDERALGDPLAAALRGKRLDDEAGVGVGDRVRLAHLVLEAPMRDPETKARGLHDLRAHLRHSRGRDRTVARLRAAAARSPRRIPPRPRRRRSSRPCSEPELHALRASASTSGTSSASFFIFPPW